MSGNQNCQEVRNLLKVTIMLEVVGKILAGLSHSPPLRQAREASPSSPPLQAISQDTRDFIQVSNTQESPRTVEKGTSS